MSAHSLKHTRTTRIERAVHDEASGWPAYERVYDLLVQCCGPNRVWRLAQPRRAMQSPGLPDLIAFSPLRGGAHISVKHGSGRESRDQQRFHACCTDAGWTYITGDVEAVKAWLGRKD